jgi:hypothetical protein
MSELTPASDRRALDAELLPGFESELPSTRLDCQGCPVAAGEVPDASCAECVVSVFLSAEPWPSDGF